MRELAFLRILKYRKLNEWIKIIIELNENICRRNGRLRDILVKFCGYIVSK